MCFRFIDEVTLLIVEREPSDVYGAVTHGQPVFTIPYTVAVGENLHVAIATTFHFWLRTDTRQHCRNLTVVQSVKTTFYFKTQPEDMCALIFGKFVQLFNGVMER